MNENEILEKGFEKLASNLYSKNNKMFVQHAGEIKDTSELSEETNELENLKIKEKRLIKHYQYIKTNFEKGILFESLEELE